MIKYKKLSLAVFWTFVGCACFISCKSKPDSPVHIFKFAGEDWIFPSTIGESVQRNNLLFIPPAFYYKTWGVSNQISLHFDWVSGDFDNDLQQKEELYDRDVNTYTFRIKRTEKTYDSLKVAIENAYHKKFRLVKGIRTNDSSLSGKEISPFEHQLIQVDSFLTIGIKNSYHYDLGDIVTVNFLYGLSLGDIGNQVGNP